MESETELEIFNCIYDDDVEGLKSLMPYPNLFQIEDYDGLTILQKAIVNESAAVFEFLLSLEGYPINARNSKGQTAIEVALDTCDSIYPRTNNGIDFIYPLVKKGAYVDWRNCQETLGLNTILENGNFNIVRCLIENGWDLNLQDSYSGQTPFHRFIYGLPNYGEELLAMMLYFGGDPSIPDFCGFTPIDVTFECRVHLSESMLEHLIFYLFDDYYPGYDIPIGSLFGLLKLESPLVPQILKHIISVNVDAEDDGWSLYWKEIFTIKPEYLNLLLKKFDYVIEAILDATLEYYEFTKVLILQEISIENCDLLFQSQFSSDIIQIINNEFPSIHHLITQAEKADKPHSEIFDIILFLLSYGVNIYDSDLELIYEKFGDCEFFRMLLHMDIKINEFQRYKNDIMPRLLYNVHIMDIETFLSDPKKYKCSAKALKQLLNYFVHPKLRDLCCRASVQIEDIHGRMKELPSVPFLVELARNEVRKFLIRKYKIKNSMQFYTLIKHLPISKIHQKIITLETKLY